MAAACLLSITGICLGQPGGASPKAGTAPLPSPYGEAVYQGLEGTFDFKVPDERQPTRGGLASSISFKFLVRPKNGAGLKVIPEKCRLLMVQANEGDEWRMQPAMMEAPKFSSYKWQADGMLVTLRLPLRMGRESSLTLVSGTIAVEVQGGAEKLSTGRLEPVKGLKMKLGGAAADLESVAVYDDGRQVLVVKPEASTGVWQTARYKSADPTAVPAEVTCDGPIDGRMIYQFPAKVPPGEFVAEVRQSTGEADIPFLAVVPNRNLFGTLAGLPIEPIPNVKGEVLKPGQVPMPVASTGAAKGAGAGPLQATWQKGEMLRCSVESFNNTHMPGDLGTDLQIRGRNDLKIEVLELMASGNARLGLTFERVRVEETDEGKYRMTDTRDDTPEKQAANPWSKVVGQRIELLHAAADGKVTLVDEAALMKRLAGKDLILTMTLKRLLRPLDLQTLIDNMKPRFSPQSRATPGAVWRNEMDPRIPLSEFKLRGEERVLMANGPRLMLGASYKLPADVPPEKLVGQQLEFQMVSARYKQVDLTRSMDWDDEQKTCTHFSMEVLTVLEGKLKDEKLKIESTYKEHGWLLERQVPPP